MKSSIDLTWSKLMGLLILLYGYHMDLRTEGHTALVYVVPFVVILVVGKQALDRNKEKK